MLPITLSQRSPTAIGLRSSLFGSGLIRGTSLQAVRQSRARGRRWPSRTRAAMMAMSARTPLSAVVAARKSSFVHPDRPDAVPLPSRWIMVSTVAGSTGKDGGRVGTSGSGVSAGGCFAFKMSTTTGSFGSATFPGASARTAFPRRFSPARRSTRAACFS
eukprot:PhF_6_TR22574/c1_g1_i1/m.32146